MLPPFGSIAPGPRRMVWPRRNNEEPDDANYIGGGVPAPAPELPPPALIGVPIPPPGPMSSTGFAAAPVGVFFLRNGNPFANHSGAASFFR